jgi:carbon-monoxide dehydrogenase medium subunit
VRIPRLPDGARWGYVKACRKPGDFAHAMAAVLLTAHTRRVVIGALGGRPLLLEREAASIDGAAHALQALDRLDQVQRHMQFATVRRALADADA